ncbi:MAG: hypothetical protein I3J02_08075 [Prevotella sp.]|nr:hypothetical protein [Prevotella sp.]
MKRLFFTWLAVVCAVTCFADTGKSLFLTLTDNTKVEFALAETPAIMVANDTLTVVTTSTTVTYLLQKVSTITYGVTTAVHAVILDGVSITPERVVFDGTACSVRIFALDGSRVTAHPVVVGNQTIVPLGNLPHGIYIINMNGQSVKIARK